MEPGNGTNYEVEARSYFESLRRPFERTLEATRKNRPKLVARIAWLIAFVGISATPFAWTRVVTFVFHQNTYVLFGKAHTIIETAGFVIVWSLIGMMAVGSLLHDITKNLELESAVKPLSQRVMVFALCYAILLELESYKRSALPHHLQTIIELWGKLLTYLRWTLQGITPDTAHFHGLPSSDYPVAPHAEHLAKALKWNEIRKTEYDVIVALNSLHSKISPRLQKGWDYRDLPRLETMFRGIGNFFYATIARSPLDLDDEKRDSWGYGKLLEAANIVNHLPVIMESPRSAPFLSAKVFTHTNIPVAFLVWWIVFQTLFIGLISLSFRFFPTLTMNSQAMVALIAAPIAAAISMVGISRRSS